MENRKSKGMYVATQTRMLKRKCEWKEKKAEEKTKETKLTKQFSLISQLEEKTKQNTHTLGL